MSDFARHIMQIVENKVVSGQFQSRIGHYYASHSSVVYGNDILGHCIRALYYNYSNAPKPTISAAMIGRTELGVAWEDHMRTTLQNAGKLITKEDRPDLHTIEYKDDRGFTIRGKTDIVINLNEIVVLELKSAGGYTTRSLVFPEKKGAVPTPVITHVLQAFFYAYMLRDRVQHVELLYGDRLSGSMQAFRIGVVPNTDTLSIDMVRQDGVTFKGIIERFNDLNTYLINEELPPRDRVPNYPASVIKELYGQGKMVKKYGGKGISKTMYDKYMSGALPAISDTECSYCDYLPLCLRNTTK